VGQVWDILPAQWEKINYVLGRRRCSCCGAVNTAVPPCGQAVAVVYGPNLNAAAILPSSQGNVPVEATARMMEALLGAKVSTGFVARAHERLAQALAGAGFDDAMVAARRAEDVLCADETPVNVVDNVDDDGGVATGSPHVVTIRTPDERLVWYREVTARSSAQIRNLGVFDGWHEVLVVTTTPATTSSTPPLTQSSNAARTCCATSTTSPGSTTTTKSGPNRPPARSRPLPSSSTRPPPPVRTSTQRRWPRRYRS